MKTLQDNPFWLGTQIPDKYFCDREKETEDMIRLITNRNNVVLKAERRTGKTSLLHHISTRRAIVETLNTYYIDIYATKSLAEFVKTFADALGAKAINDITRTSLIDAVKSIQFTIGSNVITGKPELSVGMNPSAIIRPEVSIREIFAWLETTKKQNLIIFDEFQQIKDYEDGDAAPLLRSYIQSSNNCVFVFSGSDKHMLDIMFTDENEPFFRSCTERNLQLIPEDVYCSHAEKMFMMGKCEADAASLKQLYRLTYGYTAYLNRVLNGAYSFLSPGDKCDSHVICQSLQNILDGIDFYDRLKGYSKSDLELLKAIARNRVVTAPTSSSFIKDNYLVSASKVQTSLNKLLRNKLVMDVGKTSRKIQLADVFMEIWLRVAFDKVSLANQLESAAELL
jgi:AAA+ ATPase superfamily predicted ATPase